MQQKYELGTRLTYFWHKNEKKISLNCIFIFDPLRFWHTCRSFLLSKLVSQIKLIQSLVESVASFRVLGSQFQGPGCQGLVFQGPRVPGPGSHGSRVTGLRIPGLCIPESWVSGLRVPDSRVLGAGVSGSRVLGLRFSGFKVFQGIWFSGLILDYSYFSL